MPIPILSALIGGGGIKAIENIATEWIETDLESAEAKVLKIKALDPNGMMRRNLSQFASQAYGFYLTATVVLIFMHSFGVGNPEQSKQAIEAMTALFLPITTAWGGIVSASFGVNASNNWKDVKLGKADS